MINISCYDKYIEIFLKFQLYLIYLFRYVKYVKFFSNLLMKMLLLLKMYLKKILFKFYYKIAHV
jgi:hypothetical protein